MYDPRMEPREFVGDARKEAVQKACKFFGVEADELAIGEFETGAVYGAAGRTIIVAAPRSARGSRPGGGSREDRGERRRRGRRERRPTEREIVAPEEPSEPIELDEPEGPSTGTALGDVGELGMFVLGVVERMDLGPFEVSESQDAGLIVVHVRGPAARRLALGDSRASDALQLVLNQAAVRLGGEERQKVVVDVEGDAQNRESFLESLAQRVARRARSSGRAVALDPMNPKDRRTVHVALRDERDIATMSVGEGRYRQVVIVPEGAPEFEQARRESREAAARSAPP